VWRLDCYNVSQHYYSIFPAIFMDALDTQEGPCPFRAAIEPSFTIPEQVMSKVGVDARVTVVSEPWTGQ